MMLGRISLCASVNQQWYRTPPWRRADVQDRGLRTSGPGYSLFGRCSNMSITRPPVLNNPPKNRRQVATGVLPSWFYLPSSPATEEVLAPSGGYLDHLFQTLFFTIVLYTTIMLVYRWLCSKVEEDNSDDLASGEGSTPFTQARVRSFTSGLKSNQAAGNNPLERYKKALAEKAAEVLINQVRDVRQMVRLAVSLRKANGGELKYRSPLHHLPLNNFINSVLDDLGSTTIMRADEEDVVNYVTQQVAMKLALEEIYTLAELSQAGIKWAK